jgi:hypothetical protein
MMSLIRMSTRRRYKHRELSWKLYVKLNTGSREVIRLMIGIEEVDLIVASFLPPSLGH